MIEELKRRPKMEYSLEPGQYRVKDDIVHPNITRKDLKFGPVS